MGSGPSLVENQPQDQGAAAVSFVDSFCSWGSRSVSCPTLIAAHLALACFLSFTISYSSWWESLLFWNSCCLEQTYFISQINWFSPHFQWNDIFFPYLVLPLNFSLFTFKSVWALFAQKMYIDVSGNFVFVSWARLGFNCILWCSKELGDTGYTIKNKTVLNMP